MGMESFSLYVGLTDQAKATFPAVFGHFGLNRLPCTFGARKDKQLAVRENSIHVEEEQLDLFGAFLGHGRILAGTSHLTGVPPRRTGEATGE